MSNKTVCKLIVALLFLLSLQARAKKPNAQDVQLAIKADASGKSLVTWSITNNSKLAVYVYDFYLWGPTAWVERTGNRIVLSTAPTKEEATCPPNRFPPVLLLVIAPGRTIHGEFADSELKMPATADVSMRIAVGSDPYSVVAEAKRFADSNCKHSPYDAIVRWGTMIESNTIHVP
jgi:hypothetical protein